MIRSILMAAIATVLAAPAFADTAVGDPERVLIQFNDFGAAHAAVAQQGGTVLKEFPQLRTVAAKVPVQAQAALANNPNVTLVEQDVPRFPYGQSKPWGITRIGADQVWDANGDGTIDSGATTGAGRLVCIIDSGIQKDHPDFGGNNIVGGYPAGWDYDKCGHGTHVAGTVFAANNDRGVVGVSPGATSVYAVKVFGDDCSWSYSSDLIDAAYRCRDAGANVISMSLGGGFKSRTEEKAFTDLHNNYGILSIAAAGNDGSNRKSYPASYADVVSVAATDSSDAKASFSQYNDAVDIAAPGVGVLSTVPWLDDSYVSVGGTVYRGQRLEYAPETELLSAKTLQGAGKCTSAETSATDLSGKIALCLRGDISFADKVTNAKAAGAIAVVIYNNASGGFAGTLGAEGAWIPAIAISGEDGTYLDSIDPVSADFKSKFTQPGEGYEAWDGTSMATPHVSAVAALAWSANTNLTNADIRSVLETTAYDLGVAGRDDSFGHGLVQAKAAVDAVLGTGGGNTAPVVSISSPTDGASFVEGTDILFEGTATDNEDGSLSASLAWTSDKDGAIGTGASLSAQLSANTHVITAKATDSAGATGSSSITVTVTSSSGGGGGDTTAPVISNVAAQQTHKNGSFEITWTTDEASDSEVVFTCCGTHYDATPVTSHRMTFRGSKGTTYDYYVGSTDAAGNKATSGPYTITIK